MGAMAEDRVERTTAEAACMLMVLVGTMGVVRRMPIHTVAMWGGQVIAMAILNCGACIWARVAEAVTTTVDNRVVGMAVASFILRHNRWRCKAELKPMVRRPSQVALRKTTGHG